MSDDKAKWNIRGRQPGRAKRKNLAFSDERGEDALRVEKIPDSGIVPLSGLVETETEVESSGSMPPEKVFKNSPNIFPELNLDILKEQSEIWAMRFPLIDLISLHLGVGDPPYVLVVEVPGIDDRPTGESRKTRNEGLEKLRAAWQPDSLRSLVDVPYSGSFEGSKTGYDPWMIELHEPGEEIIEVFEGKCWLLFQKRQSHSLGRLPFPCPPGTRWEGITLVLKSEELFCVRTPMGEARVRYDLLGFADKRKGEEPNKTTWPLLQVFARLEGTISIESPHYIRQLPDRARRLSKHLQGIFGIGESIYTGHYKKHQRY